MIDASKIITAEMKAASAVSEGREAMQCSPLQGQLALGETRWTAVEALADDTETPWALRRVIKSAQIWRRTDADMDALIWAMGLSPEEADDLFRLAMTL